MKSSLNGSKSFMNADQQIQIRAPKSFPFALKRLLIEWGFARGSIYVDTSLLLLTVEGKSVVQAIVKDYELDVQWLSDEWSQWQELRGDPGYLELQVASQERLNKAKLSISKGKGKSKTA